jgi:hypothetical protein
VTQPITDKYIGPPLWVKRSGIIALVIVLVFATHLIFIGGIAGMHLAATPK